MNLLDFPKGFIEELTEIRRDIHAHPEISFDVHRTADLVSSYLKKWNIPVTRGLGKTGVVGVIEGTKPTKGKAKTIGLRADMDALPMQEQNTFAHASKYENRMHACGHDGHTTMLLGAAHWLSLHRNFAGKVVFIFQPSEETIGGAKKMIEDGLLKQFPLDAVFGMHCWPGHKVGEFGLRAGAIMAASNTFRVTVHGRGGHAAQPHRTIDPIMTAIQIAQAWQTIITRNKEPLKTAVLSVTQIHAGTAFNVIPEKADLIGTVRNFEPDVLNLIETRMREIAENIAAAFNSSIEFRFWRGYPAVINHKKETELAARTLREIVGEKQVNDDVTPTMTAEDFSYYLKEAPGCFAFIGNGREEHRNDLKEKQICGLHHPRFDFNDALIPLGTTYYVKLVRNFFDDNS